MYLMEFQLQSKGYGTLEVVELYYQIFVRRVDLLLSFFPSAEKHDWFIIPTLPLIILSNIYKLITGHEFQLVLPLHVSLIIGELNFIYLLAT